MTKRGSSQNVFYRRKTRRWTSILESFSVLKTLSKRHFFMESLLLYRRTENGLLFLQQSWQKTNYSIEKMLNFFLSFHKREDLSLHRSAAKSLTSIEEPLKNLFLKKSFQKSTLGIEKLLKASLQNNCLGHQSIEELQSSSLPIKGIQTI